MQLYTVKHNTHKRIASGSASLARVRLAGDDYCQLQLVDGAGKPAGNVAVILEYSSPLTSRPGARPPQPGAYPVVPPSPTPGPKVCSSGSDSLGNGTGDGSSSGQLTAVPTRQYSRSQPGTAVARKEEELQVGGLGRRLAPLLALLQPLQWTQQCQELIQTSAIQACLPACLPACTSARLQPPPPPGAGALARLQGHHQRRP